MSQNKNTRKNRLRSPGKGWSKEQPNTRQRTTMLKKCGRKCFLGDKKSYPVCKKNTCKISKKGVFAAYIRASQMHARSIKKRAILLYKKLSRSKKSRKSRKSRK